MSFTSKLIDWYQSNKRELPWRARKDPYAIWLSEIILQQTRIEQGLKYYEAFIETYPTVFDLAKAEEEDVLKLWQGLGYYSRARNLHHTAISIVETHKGIFPENHSGLMKLKGIGDYTASAISSICYNEPQAVVDGNVYRVLSRVFGIFTPINSSQGAKEFKTLAQKLIDTKQPGEFNQALMEFGATHCKPQNPGCEHCVFSSTCVALKKEFVMQLPVKTGKTKVRKRYFNYLVLVSDDEKTILEKRTEKGIWKNLYQFPLIEKENSSKITFEEVEKCFPEIEIDSVTVHNEIPLTHKLSHQHLQIQFWVASTAALGEKGLPISKINELPVPIVIHNFIVDFSF
ncbi:MAG: A/G-specific adenine glycosylase [Flavobacteriaceae bacterium]|nr:A/G-specific adenine glycosylase [Flavobacteriaceae bacterium]